MDRQRERQRDRETERETDRQGGWGMGDIVMKQPFNSASDCQLSDGCLHGQLVA